MSEDKITLTKDQVQILELLNIKLAHDFWPKLIQASKNGLIRFDVNSDDFKYGYAKAVWDITVATTAAIDGHLPTKKTLEQWAKSSDVKIDQYLHHLNNLDWENFKYTKDGKKL